MPFFSMLCGAKRMNSLIVQMIAFVSLDVTFVTLVDGMY